MRLATIIDGGRPVVALVEGDRARPIHDGSSMRIWAEAGHAGIDRVRAWVADHPGDRWLPLADVELGPAIADPGAIYTIGVNYRDRATAARAGVADPRLPRPLVYGKLRTSVAGHGATLAW